MVSSRPPLARCRNIRAPASVRNANMRPPSRGAKTPGLCKSLVPPGREGAGNAGRPMRPIAACAMVVRSAHALVRSHRNHPAFPAQWFYGLYRALPGDRLSCHRRLRKSLPANLTPASGRQDHTTSPSASSTRPSSAPPRPPHPAPRFVTLRNAPRLERDGQGYRLICDFGKSEYFFERGLTEGSVNRPGDLPVGLFSAPRRGREVLCRSTLHLQFSRSALLAQAGSTAPV